MSFKKAAPMIGVLVVIGLGISARAGHAGPRDTPTTPVPPKDEKSVTGTDNVVGEYSLITGPDIFLPSQLCAVDPELTVLQQLQQCKNKRMGWLRL
tara:strand:- start:110 stop:397 length:288 start_codon:yes stop_codon:yes gene_type:complete